MFHRSLWSSSKFEHSIVLDPDMQLEPSRVCVRRICGLLFFTGSQVHPEACLSQLSFRRLFADRKGELVFNMS